MKVSGFVKNWYTSVLGSLLLGLILFAPSIRAASMFTKTSTAVALEKVLLQKYHENFTNRSTMKKLLDVCKFTMLWPLTTENFFHEMGHAVAAKLLMNCPINVHLGVSSSDVPKSLRKPGITLHSFDSFKAGFNELDYNKVLATGGRSKQYVVSILAGPLSGLATLGVLNKTLNVIASKYSTNKDIITIVRIYKVLIYVFMIDAFIYGLTPCSYKGSDGHLLWGVYAHPYVTSAVYLLSFALLAKKLLDKARLQKSRSSGFSIGSDGVVRKDGTQLSDFRNRISDDHKQQ